MYGKLIEITLKALREHLNANNGIMDIYCGNGYMTKVKCTFNEPATEEEIELFEKQAGLALPLDYKNFLKQCNGCSIFDDIEFGGESYLFDLKQVMEYYHEYMPKGWYVVGYFYEDIIIMDLNRYHSGNMNYLLVNSAYLSDEYAEELKCNFEIWFDRIISTQGEKFWRWKLYTADNYYKLCMDQ